MAFNSQLKLTECFMKCNGGQGLSVMDMKRIFDVLDHPEFDIKKVVMRSGRDMRQFMNSLVEAVGHVSTTQHI